MSQDLKLVATLNQALVIANKQVVRDNEVHILVPAGRQPFQLIRRLVNSCEDSLILDCPAQDAPISCRLCLVHFPQQCARFRTHTNWQNTCSSQGVLAWGGVGFMGSSVDTLICTGQLIHDSTSQPVLGAANASERCKDDEHHCT